MAEAVDWGSLQRAARHSRILTDAAARAAYSADNSKRIAQPDAVAIAAHVDEVAAIVAWCHDHRVPLTVRGRGTNTVGGSVPVHGGVVLSMEALDRIETPNHKDRYIRVEAGATNGAVQRAVADLGFFWAPDPTSADYASVGGNLGCNAGGPAAVKYGTCRENTLGLTAVTGTGAVLNCGTVTTKGVVGYDFTRLLIGSEGTLGIITNAALKLTPKPPLRQSLRAVYSDIGAACEAVAAIMAQPATPCALEFMDTAAVRLVRDLPGVDLPAQAAALLLIEADGDAASLPASVAAIAAAARNPGLLDWAAADGADERTALWAARKALSPKLRQIAPHKVNEDVVVPVSRMPELIAQLTAISERFGVPIVNFGHAGNGNVHVNLLADPASPTQMEAVEPCLDAVFDLVLRLDGTLSGEHGVGLAKQAYVDRELSEWNLELMRQVKAVFDPRGILNPGKLAL